MFWLKSVGALNKKHCLKYYWNILLCLRVHNKIHFLFTYWHLSFAQTISHTKQSTLVYGVCTQVIMKYVCMIVTVNKYRAVNIFFGNWNL